jgi:hypothetical protein
MDVEEPLYECTGCGMEFSDPLALNDYGVCFDCVDEYVFCPRCECDCYEENISDEGICYECAAKENLNH